MVVVAPQGDAPEEGVDTAVALVINGFVREGLFVIWEQGAVVVEGGNDALAVAQEGVAQALLNPLGAGTGAAGA
jgi:hypothetical protein